MSIKLTRWIIALAISATGMGWALASAARAQDALGLWNGTIHVPTGDLRVGLEVTANPSGGLAGRLESPDQGPGAIPLDEISVQDGHLKFSIGRIRASYSAQWDSAKGAWVGQWNQGGDLPLTLTRGRPDARPVIAGLDGDWEGVLPLKTGGRLRLVLKVRTSKDGTIALLDSPDQLAFGLPIGMLSRTGTAIAFSQAAIGASYSGALGADAKSIVGTLTQGGQSSPLTFVWKAAETAQPKRPQTPSKPYPYREETVFIDSAPGVRLAGTLTLPNGSGPFPAAVMITGSGAQDRDETILGHRPFLIIADTLTRAGIAVLRVDDRGFAQSTGDFAKATTADFAVDAAANVAFLRARPDIDPSRIGLIGHSEGGLVGPMVAAQDPRIAFVVLLAGPGVPLADVLSEQRAEMAPSMGQTPEAIRKGETLMKHVIDAMRDATDDADAEARALKVLNREGAAAGIPAAAQSTTAKQMSSRWMRALLAYDPRPTLAKVKAPVLALNGSKDMQVPAKQNLPGVRAALAMNPDATVVELPGLNHLFQTAPTGAAGEYADIEETFAPAALNLIRDWVVKHTKP